MTRSSRWSTTKSTPCAPKTMPRAVLDSSVLVSAFIKPHGPVAGLLLDPVRSRYQLCLSERILDETAMTLLTKEKLRRFFAYSSEPLEYVHWLRTEAEMVGDLL